MKQAQRSDHLTDCPRPSGIKESDTGLSAPSTWDTVADKQVMQQENPLQVARCTKIINADTENAQSVLLLLLPHVLTSLCHRYMINVKQIAKFVVALGDNVSPMDIEEGMRVGVDRSGKYQVGTPCFPGFDPVHSSFEGDFMWDSLVNC